MASFNVFGAEVPVVTNADDADSLALGTVVLIGEAGTVTHARWHFPNPLPSGPVTWRLSDLDTLELLGSHVFTSPVSGWVEQALTPPISIAAPRNVLVWIGTPDDYVFTNGKFTSAAIVSGPLTAPATADDPEGVGNGRFGGDPDSPPLGTSGATAYFADLVFAELPPQGEAAFALNFALAGTGEAPAVPPSQGEAAFTLNLAVAATGDAPPIDPSEGEAEFGLIYQFAGVGHTPSEDPAEGSAAFTLNLALAATGGRASAGSAAFTLNLAVAGVGSNGDEPPFVCRPVRSFSEVMPS